MGARAMDFSKSFSVFNTVPAFASKYLPWPVFALCRCVISLSPSLSLWALGLSCVRAMASLRHQSPLYDIPVTALFRQGQKFAWTVGAVQDIPQYLCPPPARGGPQRGRVALLRRRPEEYARFCMIAFAGAHVPACATRATRLGR